VVLCSAIADSFNFFAQKIEAGEKARAVAAASLVQHGLKAVFNGNNYKAEWKAEADARGIFSADSVVHAMSRIESENATALFKRVAVFSEEELATRAELCYENYYITVITEARTLLSMVATLLVPAARSAGVAEAAELGKKIEAAAAELQTAMAEIDGEEVGTIDSATLCTAMRLGVMVKVRNLVDELERLLPAKEWPLATYDELLFNDMAACTPIAE